MAFLYKLYFYYYIGSHPIVIVTIASSMLSIVLGWHQLLSLLVIRWELKSFIGKKLEDTSLSKNERQSLETLRCRHFGKRRKAPMSQELSTSASPELVNFEI